MTQAKLTWRDQAGDQGARRGTRSADGSELAAERCLGKHSEHCRHDSSIDTASSTINVMDLIAKKPVDVKITQDSQLRKLPPQMAQFMAMRLKGGQAGAGSGRLGMVLALPMARSQRVRRELRDRGLAAHRQTAVKARVGGAEAEIFSRYSNRVPRATLSDLQKGDAVMIVSTAGSGSGGVTAITLVSGVEPILQASPNGSGQSMILPPGAWKRRRAMRHSKGT